MKLHKIIDSLKIKLKDAVSHYKAGGTFRDCENCPEMVKIPAGSFMMGSPDDEEGGDSGEGPQHEVTIPAAFAVGKYAVTLGQYREFAEADGRGVTNSWQEPGFVQAEDHPVVNVSWYEAKKYVEWLLKKTGKKYRLLSEAEWEYVARARTTTRYHFGDAISPSLANYEASEHGGTVAVGSYPANAFGLHDVHGNVWEWVEDHWHYEYHNAPKDGSARTNDYISNPRVLRGGSWYHKHEYLRSAKRVSRKEEDPGDNTIGFRVARDLSS